MRRRGAARRAGEAWFLPFLFMACALPVLVLTALLTPPGQSPDEPAHLVRANSLLRGAFVPVRKSGVNPYTGTPIQQVG